MLRKLAFIPPVLLGAGILVLLVVNQRGPERKPPTEVARVLRTIAVPRADVVPRAIGYGTAEPGRTWRCVPEVSGALTWVRDELAAGAVVPAGTEIFRVDSSVYVLSAERLRAEIMQTQAQLLELSGTQKNLEASLAIERQSVVVAERDLARAKELSKQSAGTEQAVDQAARTLLAQQQSLQSLENQLALLPAQKSSLEAALAVKQTSLASAELDLSKTIVRAPFSCRLRDVELQVGQFVQVGQVLFEAVGLDLTEVEAEFLVDDARVLLGGRERPQLDAPLDQLDAAGLQRIFRVDATVRFRAGGLNASWEAELQRIRERIDSDTRTIRFVVAVKDPYAKAEPGVRPPLLGGMFCEVELRGQARADAVIVPRSAIRAGAVWLVDDERRLERRPVTVGFAQDDFVAINAGLAGGEQLVVGDPTPAVEGSLVEPAPDAEVRQRLLAQATGQALADDSNGVGSR